ncbi:unnamed protein product [Dimorphilus gyrociliatus]|uniref:Glucosamine 6-phosphate N-acetyltransferase n=1 Tax=Dimorphilus gyrociliatus TaxID=2664684 RepID=A0A7I8VSK6_9ANNE|nr:unnamed protein product [Dimorphilus gyrociliatus]
MTKFNDLPSDDNSYLFDPKILKDINWENATCTFKNNISIANPGDSLVMRPLRDDDFHQDYLELLGQLTKVGKIEEETFFKRFEEMKECCGTYYIIVIEDLKNNRIIGTSSLIIEHKFIHTAGQRGRIEDVVVDNEFRGKQLGKLLVQALVLVAKKLGVYKISLECKIHNIPFYELFGFKKDEQSFMIQRFEEMY